jgi:hypothetical protein
MTVGRIRVPAFGRPGVSFHRRLARYDPAAYARAPSGDPYGPFAASFFGRAIEAVLSLPAPRTRSEGPPGPFLRFRRASSRS